ncbi:hypothetical protein B0T10DRAFT_579005 [Thelonectria olida]|uniref:Uncharacterized protein n=1 Tax=Thelonectria olida TaxID=1576542 RepID=A0A9P8W0U8_9HYPO|nr:hypothetical protein B0T10DRAFT_579005 [Thelonectria olida]
MFALLLQQCLPHPSQANEEVPLRWMRCVPRMSSSNLLTSVMSTLTWGWYGNIDGRRDLAHRSRQEYGRALSTLRSAASTVGNDAGRDLEVLVAAELLVLYEIYEFGARSDRGWLTHLAGAENILQMSGLSARTPTNISVSNISSYQCLHSGDKFHDLLDIGAQVAQFLSDIDYASTTSPDHTLCIDYPRLLKRYLSLVEVLETWRATSGIDSCAIFPISTPSFDLEDGEGNSETDAHTLYPSKHPQSLGIPFDTLQAARFLHLCSSLLLALDLAGLRFEQSTVHSRAHSLESWLEILIGQMLPEKRYRLARAKSLADNITLWADICIQSAWQSFGPVMGTFSLATALEWYQFETNYTDAGTDETRDESLKTNMSHCARLLQRLQPR